VLVKHINQYSVTLLLFVRSVYLCSCTV